jgi:hypothetical protein
VTSLPEPLEGAIRHDEPYHSYPTPAAHEIEDPLTAVLRSGARRLLAQAIEAEAEAFLAEMKGERLPDGRDRLVRHGHGPERLVQTGIGPVAVQRVKLRDRGAGEEMGGERIRFTSTLLPRWARRTRRGCPCVAPAMPNGRCRMRGGTSTGPRTPEGQERCRTAPLKHGRRCAEAREAARLRGQARRINAGMRALMRMIRPGSDAARNEVMDLFVEWEVKVLAAQKAAVSFRRP